MAINYLINCKHCGLHSEHLTWLSMRAMQYPEDELVKHVDTECAIRCPVCRARLNTSEAQFREQVTIVCLK